MRWPAHAVERVRPSKFHPPFCPWNRCRAHRGPGSGFHRHGFYRRKQDTTLVPRFLCLDCGRTCSRQTFSTTYYLKRPALLARVAAALLACSAHRQIARSELCAKTTVTRLTERLGRHAILFCAYVRSRAPSLLEPIVHDHFETFIGRQDRGLGIGTAVGSSTRFVLDVDPAPHRGPGRRPDAKPDARAWVAPHAPYVQSIARTLSALLATGRREILLKADGRRDYVAAIEKTESASMIRLIAYPNPRRGPKGSTRSREAALRDRAMGPVDQLHKMLRHSCADHKRETIAFGRRLESSLGRAHLLAAWKNFIKLCNENGPLRTTPAMRHGIVDEPWTWQRILTQRLFVAREALSDSELRIYEKRWTVSLPSLALVNAG